MGELMKGTILIISHQERILNIADEVILMKNGKVEKIGKSNDVLKEELCINGTCCKLKK